MVPDPFKRYNHVVASQKAAATQEDLSTQGGGDERGGGPASVGEID